MVHATWASALAVRLKSGITHPYSNFLFLGHWGTPVSPQLNAPSGAVIQSADGVDLRSSPALPVGKADCGWAYGPRKQLQGPAYSLFNKILVIFFPSVH